MVTLLEYAQLADKAYVPSTDASPSIAGWRSSRIRALDADQGAKDPRWEGLQCRAFRRIHGKDVVIAFRGTACGADFLSDAKLSAWGIPMRCHEAIRLTETWKAHYSGRSVTLTGHSLGGAIAQVAGIVTNTRFVTFNAPGMWSNCVGVCSFPKLMNTLSRGMNFIKWGDTIGNFGKHIGDTRRVQFSSVANLIPLGAHRMGGFIDFLKTYPGSDQDPLA
jgi:hypothetical protein